MARRFAFAIMNKDGEGSILFAAHEKAALKRAKRDMVLGVEDESGIAVVRAPYADAYAKTGAVPASVMIAHGWRLDCAACGKRFDADHLAAKGLPIDGVQGIQHGPVYCGPEAKGRHLVQAARVARERHRALSALEQIVLKRHPDAKILTGPGTSHAYVTVEGDVPLFQEGSVSFAFPGMAHGPATIEVRRGLKPIDKVGPVKPHFTYRAGDEEAYLAWARSTAAAA